LGIHQIERCIGVKHNQVFETIDLVVFQGGNTTLIVEKVERN
jgi:hypothetical protein